MKNHYVVKNSNSQNINKIAFVGNTSFSLYKFRLGVMLSFISEGYEVIAIAPEDEYSCLFQNEKIKYIPIEIDGKGKSVIDDIKLIRRFADIYKREKIDFIFHYTIKPNIYGSLAARYLRIPSIAITTGLGFSFNKKNVFTLFIKSLYRFSFQKVLEVWFLNANDKDTFVKNGVIRKEKAYILPSEGINSAYYFPQVKKTKSDKFIFLLLSRLIKEKGIEEYVAAAKMLKEKGLDIECQLLGKQERESSKSVSVTTVKSWHKAKIINYLGEFIDIREYIANSDCVVLPSYYMEGVPRCLMEAMSMERPIITTDNVGCRELIVDRVNGYMCEPRDIPDLASKMELIYYNTISERQKMGENGRKIILDCFDENKIIELYHLKFNSFFSGSHAKRLHSIIPKQINGNLFIDRHSEAFKNSFGNTTH
jgi:glycosyltransferase involved in cell wall biosynthesis